MVEKRSRNSLEVCPKEDKEIPLVRQSEDEPDQKKAKWVNKQRVLIFGCRGMASRDRHLMEDLRSLMPHSKSDSKIHRKKESLFAVNEIADMKNCNKTLLFESRRNGRALYLWAAHVSKGPSAKFQVENVHTMSELKMTGNCLRASRPILSFDKSFDPLVNPHYGLLKELFVQIFSVPRRHPKSQPFFDRVYSFSVADGKIWFRHYQIADEDGSLAEIGPRFVLNPIKIFDASFSGATLWENPKYVTPTATRQMLKKIKAGKYLSKVQSKAAYEAGRPTEPTYKVDATDDVFRDIDVEETQHTNVTSSVVVSRKKKPQRKKKHVLDGIETKA